MSFFEGSMVAIVTPFKEGKIDESRLCELIDFQIENNTSVIIPCGTTGESATLSHEEHERVIALTVKHVAGRVRVLAGAGSNNTAEAIRLHRFCHQIGADGTLQITPYYNKPTQAGLVEHFSAIAKSADLPIVLYNVPGRTALNMLAETTILLSRIDSIVGIKEASGNLEQAKKIIEETDDSFSILSGEDALTCELYALGAKGAISVTCNVKPKECAEEYQLFMAEDRAAAQAVHEGLMPLHQAMFFETNPIPVKAALAMMGKIEEEYRLPLVKMCEGNREKLQKVLQQQGLISL